MNLVTIGSLIQLLEEAGVENEILELSLNQKNDESYVLINHSMDYCRVNRLMNDTFVSQFHTSKINGGEWRVLESGCRCTKFIQLNLDSLPNNWKEKMNVQIIGMPFIFQNIEG